MSTIRRRQIATTARCRCAAVLYVVLTLAACAEEEMVKRPTPQARDQERIAIERSQQQNGAKSPTVQTQGQKIVIERRATSTRAGTQIAERRIVDGKVEESTYVVTNPAVEAAAKMSLRQARKVIVEKFPRVISYREREVGGFFGGSYDITDFTLSAARVLPYHIEYDYRLVRSTRGYTCPPGNDLCSGQRAGMYRVDLKKIAALVEVTRDCPACSGWCLAAGGKEIDMDLVWSDYADARAVADALNRLVTFAQGERTPAEEEALRQFPQQAAAWRALPVKPAISEPVRRHRLLAENAIKERQFDSALEEYEAGLQIDPVWPEGHFNAALLYAETGYYSEAVSHMRAYLELVPDAPDALSARDQIIIWETKLPRD